MSPECYEVWNFKLDKHHREGGYASKFYKELRDSVPCILRALSRIPVIGWLMNDYWDVKWHQTQEKLLGKDMRYISGHFLTEPHVDVMSSSKEEAIKKVVSKQDQLEEFFDLIVDEKELKSDKYILGRF